MRLSIITINYNNAEGLRKTMESVLAQTYRNFEYIIVDGASTDGSLDVIRASVIQAEALVIKWISEPDTGIYNAMNKGVKLCSGEYTLMLNSGDFLTNEHVIERIIPELEETDIIQGNIITEKKGKWWRNRGYGRSEISFLDVQRGYFLHQASFCKKSLFEKFGYFREDFRFVSDTAFFIKTLGYGGATFRYVDIDIANFDTNGFSSSTDPIIRDAYRKEEQRMQEELFPGRLHAFCVDSERKVGLYDNLRKHRWIGNLLMLLKLINKSIYGEPHVPISEPLIND